MCSEYFSMLYCNSNLLLTRALLRFLKINTSFYISIMKLNSSSYIEKDSNIYLSKIFLNLMYDFSLWSHFSSALFLKKIFFFPFYYTMFTFYEHSLVMRNGLRPNILLNLDYNDLFIDNSLKASSMIKKKRKRKLT